MNEHPAPSTQHPAPSNGHRETELRIEDLIDIPLFQQLQDDLNKIYVFPSAIIDNEGNILTATAWQDICTKFYRKDPESVKECIKSDKYILDHIEDANPAVIYTCPHGLTDTAMPIIIGGKHLANFFTGQFLLNEPDLDFFKKQARKYGFEEEPYLKAVKNVPVISEERLSLYHTLIKTFTDILVKLGQKRLDEIQSSNKIRESEEKYRFLHENAGLGIGYYTTNGIVISYNQIAARNMNGKPEDFTGKSILELFPKKEATIYMQRIKKATSSASSIVYEDNIDLPTGNVYFMSTYNRIIGSENKIIGIQIISQDITELKNTGDSLRESNLRFNQIADHSGNWIWEVNKNGLYTYVSPIIKSILGYDPDEIINKKYFYDFFKPETKDQIKKAALESFSRKESFKDFQNVNISKDGREVILSTNGLPVLDTNGDLIGYRGVDTDITERIESEMKLRKSEEEYRSLFENSLLGISQALPEGGLFRINKAYAEMYGYASIEEMLNQVNDIKTQLYADPDDRNKVLRILQETGYMEPTEFRVIKKSGEVINVLVTAREQRNSDGKLMYFQAEHIDITERIKMETELKENQKILEKKINELERFNNLTVDRELRMVELKQEINKLLEKQGEKPRYRIVK